MDTSKNKKAEQEEWQSLKARIQYDAIRAKAKREKKINSYVNHVEGSPYKGKAIISACILLIIAVSFVIAGRYFKTVFSSPEYPPEQSLPASTQYEKLIAPEKEKANPVPLFEKNIDISPAPLLAQRGELIPQIYPSSDESRQNQIISILKGIVSEYHRTHTYSKTDMFVCSDMSIDVWNIVRTKGINAVILIGNIRQDVSNILEADHAWVCAEASPGRFVALETTGGFLVCPDSAECRFSSERYFFGWKFNNPKELKEAQYGLDHPCPKGYTLGEGLRCYPACGANTYCRGDSVCVDGQCRGCEPGYYLGKDLQCHKS